MNPVNTVMNMQQLSLPAQTLVETPAPSQNWCHPMYFEVLVQLGKDQKENALALARSIERQEVETAIYPWEKEKPESIDSMFDRIFVTDVSKKPQKLTWLSLHESVGLKAHNRHLNDLSPAARRESLEKIRALFEILSSYNFEDLDPEQKVTYQIAYWSLKNTVEGQKFLFYPYTCSQLEGAHLALINLFTEHHKVEKVEDVDHYIERLNQIPTQLQGMLETLELQQRYGILLPRFAVEKVIGMFKGQIEVPVEENILFVTLAKGANSLNVSGKLGLAKAILNEKVYPAFASIIAYYRNMIEETSAHGVWAHPLGEEFYQYALKCETTTNLTPEQIYNLGLQEVEKIDRQMRLLLAELGISDDEKSLGDLITRMNEQGDFYFPDNDAGKKQCLEEFENILARCRRELWPLFDVKPKASVEVKTVPVHEEEGAPGAIYNSPSLDGSRPGVFRVNLRNTKELPKYGMETLAVHEAEPGHHFQLSLQQELPLPLIRKLGDYNAYIEGWALYTEKLAFEQGFYSDNYSKIGHLQDELLRAVRLVLDTGIHWKRWSREYAIEYMHKVTGYPLEVVVTEVERYFVLPGQACSYKIGQLKILELRQKAKDELGMKFDIKKFHNVVLSIGACPLEVLENVVNNYIKETLNQSA